jgi:hypothetical protein
MGYITNTLSFDTLRQANKARQEKYTNTKGELIHKTKEWNASQWLQALVGEVGEYANIRKKYERGDISADEFNEVSKRISSKVFIGDDDNWYLG